MAAAERHRLQLMTTGGVLAAVVCLVLGMGISTPVAPGASRPSRVAGPLGSDAPLTTPPAMRAFTAACTRGDRSDLQRLRELSRHDDPLLAGNAIAALGRLHAVHGDAELVAMLHDGRARVRNEVVLALGESGERDMAMKLAPMVFDPDAATAMLAVHALSRLGARSSLEHLLADPSLSPHVRAFAEAALGSYQVRPLLATTAGITSR